MSEQETQEPQETWQLYNAGREPITDEQRQAWLNDIPPWRKLGSDHPTANLPKRVMSLLNEQRGISYITADDKEVPIVNMALLLRRPLLVTGLPGVGKTSLAYRLAWFLGLGDPLRWDINSQSTLKEGLYTYDAIGHFQASQLFHIDHSDGNKNNKKTKNKQATPPDIGSFVTLGPMGTALLPAPRPRVLLIDEIDKASFDLPNDLLHVFEEGSFTIPELLRTGQTHQVYPFDRQDADDTVEIAKGRVSTYHHPVVVITSNNQRAFSQAFLRRCVKLDLEMTKDEDILHKIVRTQLGGKWSKKSLTAALGRYPDQATDFLIQALFLEKKGAKESDIKDALRR